MTDRNRWIHHIKDVRAEHGIGLFEAQRVALADPQWRRWVEHQINTDNQCRRMALSHIRFYSPEALIDMDGDRLKVR